MKISHGKDMIFDRSDNYLIRYRNIAEYFAAVDILINRRGFATVIVPFLAIS